MPTHLLASHTQSVPGTETKIVTCAHTGTIMCERDMRGQHLERRMALPMGAQKEKGRTMKGRKYDDDEYTCIHSGENDAMR